MCLGVPSICEICVCMRDVISEFNSEIERSHAFYALMFFMFSGSSLYVTCILFWGCSVCLRDKVSL